MYRKKHAHTNENQPYPVLQPYSALNFANMPHNLAA